MLVNECSLCMHRYSVGHRSPAFYPYFHNIFPHFSLQHFYIFNPALTHSRILPTPCTKSENIIPQEATSDAMTTILKKIFHFYLHIRGRHTCV